MIPDNVRDFVVANFPDNTVSPHSYVLEQLEKWGGHKFGDEDLSVFYADFESRRVSRSLWGSSLTSDLFMGCVGHFSGLIGRMHALNRFGFHVISETHRDVRQWKRDDRVQQYLLDWSNTRYYFNASDLSLIAGAAKIRCTECGKSDSDIITEIGQDGPDAYLLSCAFEKCKHGQRCSQCFNVHKDTCNISLVQEIAPSETPKPKTSVVYLIHAGGTRRYKIGWAIDAMKRLKQLQTGNPFPLSLVASQPGTEQLERQLHDIFRAFRVSEMLKNEWFEFPPNVDVITHFLTHQSPLNSPTTGGQLL